MSRSNRTDNPNPATRFFEWAAQEGKLTYYDKEKKERVGVQLPFQFLVLDEVSQVGGGTKKSGKYEGFWSNAVKNLNTQKFVVRSKDGVEAEGYYADLKERKGLYYVKGLYIAFKNGETDLQMGYLKFKGSALGAWFEFAKTHKNLYDGAFSIKSKSDVIKGDQGDYYTPVFSYTAKVTEETEDAAQGLDAQLQEYLIRYFSQQGIAEVEADYTGTSGSNDEPPDYPHREPEEPPTDDDLEDLPF